MIFVMIEFFILRVYSQKDNKEKALEYYKKSFKLLNELYKDANPLK